MQVLKRLYPTLRIIIAILASLTPLVVAQVLLYLYHAASFRQLLPIWVDELFYWHQALSFSHAGLNSGYYTVAEIPAAASFSPYYSWGIAIPAFYGSFASLFGWSLASIPVINLAVITLSAALFLYLIRTNILQSVIFGLLIGTFIPFIIFSMSSQIPLIDLSIALIMAAGFFRLIHSQAKASRKLRLGLGIFIGLACLDRVWWGIFFVPYMLLLEENYSLWRMARAVLIAGFLFLAFTWFVQYTSSPFPYWYSKLYEVTGKPTSILENLALNLSLVNDGNILEIWQRRQVLVLIVLLAGTLFFYLFRQRERTKWLDLALGLYSFAVILGFVYSLYEAFDWREYRILAPIMLMVLALLLASKRYWIVLTITAMMLWLLPEGLIVYDIWAGWHVDTEKHNAYYAWEAELQKVLQYDADASNPWCNTVLHTIHYVYVPTSTILAVDGGLGLSSPLFLETFDLPFRSRYLMLDDETYAALATELNVVPLMAIPEGQLYLNLDSECPDAYVQPTP